MARRSARSKARALLLCGVAALAVPAAALAQTQGGNLVIAFPANQEPASLDGQIDPYQSTWLLDSFVADPLVVQDPDGKYQPALATSWESSPDGKVWTFKLRSDVKFQDGTPFDAAAVKYNLDRIGDPKTASAQLKSDVGPIKSVEVVDPTTVKITYDTPWVTLLDAIRRTPIWSPTAAQKFGLANFAKNLVGAGPFTLAEWAPNDHITLKRWADYGGWNSFTHKGPAYLDQVTIRFIGESAVLGNVVKTGNAQIAYSIDASAVEDYKNKPNFQFITKDQAGTGLQMVMNIRKPPLSDVRVRRALLYANDEKAVNNLVYDGLYSASDGPLNNVHPCFWPGNSTMYPPSLDKAKALLDEAGWKLTAGDPIRKAGGVPGVADGTPLRLRYTVLHHKEIGEALQGQFRRAGIDLAVETVAGPIQLDRVNKRDFELIYERQRSLDPLILDQIWNSKWDQPGGWAWTGFKDANLDKILDQLRALPDAGQRCEAAKSAQKIIMENALMLPTLSDPVFIALSPKVKGFKMGAEGTWFYLNDTSLEK